MTKSNPLTALTFVLPNDFGRVPHFRDYAGSLVINARPIPRKWDAPNDFHKFALGDMIGIMVTLTVARPFTLKS